ncbi:hypothetical protein ACSQ67_007818 [Phaseolus vulgaris]
MIKTRNYRIRKSSRPSWTLTLTLLLTCCFLILILLTLRILSLTHSNSSNALSKPNDLTSIARNTHVTQEDDSQGESWVEIISWEPRAFIYHNFLTKEECEHLINIAKPNMRKSAVVDSETGKSMDSRVRTSSGAFLARGRDQVVRDIEKRISDLTFIPVEHGEGLQVLHYEVGQKYESHFDYFMDNINTKNGGQRIATMLMYLSDVEEGVRQCSPMRREMLALCLGGMSFLNVEKKDFQSNQRWAMLYFSGA